MRGVPINSQFPTKISRNFLKSNLDSSSENSNTVENIPNSQKFSRNVYKSNIDFTKEKQKKEVNNEAFYIKKTTALFIFFLCFLEK